MPSLCLYFKVHQPYQLKKYGASDIQVSHCYEDTAADEKCINRISDLCYLPANNTLLKNIRESGGRCKVQFSISGITLSLLQQYRPDVIQSFRELTDTGCVEILGETYYHSLSSLHSKKEFERQVVQHSEAIQALFGVTPTLFRNTELIHNNELTGILKQLGFRGLLCEGLERLLKGKSSNKVYQPPGLPDFSLLLRNSTLSDDISFRFDDPHWNEHPLTADKFAFWLHNLPGDTEVVNLFMDYETFGIHKSENTGIFAFLDALPEKVLAADDWRFATATEIIERVAPAGIYDVHQTISYEDKSKEACVWSENRMQNNTLKKIYSIENLVIMSNDERVRESWRRLQCADYYYYMADQHSRHEGYRYLNPYESPKVVFEYFTNIVTDLETSLIKKMLEENNRNYFPTAANLY